MPGDEQVYGLAQTCLPCLPYLVTNVCPLHKYSQLDAQNQSGIGPVEQDPGEHRSRTVVLSGAGHKLHETSGRRSISDATIMSCNEALKIPKASRSPLMLS